MLWLSIKFLVKLIKLDYCSDSSPCPTFNLQFQTSLENNTQACWFYGGNPLKRVENDQSTLDSFKFTFLIELGLRGLSFLCRLREPGPFLPAAANFLGCLKMAHFTVVFEHITGSNQLHSGLVWYVEFSIGAQPYTMAAYKLCLTVNNLGQNQAKCYSCFTYLHIIC